MAAPVKPVLKQGDDETNLDFGLRKAAANRAHRKAMRRWRESGDAPAEPAAEAAEPEDEEHNITKYSGGRRQAIEDALKEAEGN